jgi:hypothetical protein
LPSNPTVGGAESTVLELREPAWPTVPDTRVRASWVNAREGSDTGNTYAIHLEGWAVGSESRLQAIEVGVGGNGVWRLGINVPRPDVQELHPDVPWSHWSGFNHFLSALRLPTEFEAEVGALFEDGSRSHLITLRGRRTSLPSISSKFNPLVVTTLGRTGSTWVMALIGQHPGVVTFRPFQYEPKVCRYWTDILATLSEPASYRQPLAAELYGPHWWIGQDRQSPPPTPYDDRMEAWLGRRHVEDLAQFCRGQILAFYEEVKCEQGRPKAPLFAEKLLPGTVREQLLPELFPSVKEVFLVRDFRDMASSMLEFDRRGHFRGLLEEGTWDEDYVRTELRRDIEGLARSWTARSSSSFLLRYEDLVLNQHETLEALFSYLELDASPKLVDRIVREASDLAPAARRVHQTSASPEASIGRWQREPEHVRGALEETFADLLEVFGYGTKTVLGAVLAALPSASVATTFNL